MRKLSFTMFVTVDGVYQAPGGPEEDTSGDFRHGGWSANYWDEPMGQFMEKVMGPPFDLLLGRRTYEIFAAHWPYVEDAIGNKLNLATKYVATKTLTKLDWKHSKRVDGEVAAEVRKLKQQDGPELQVHGSGGLVQTLLENRLVDEMRLLTFPVVVGQGKRLFVDGTVPGALELVESMSSTTGVTIATYRPAGEIQPGSFALEQPTQAEVERRRKWERGG